MNVIATVRVKSSNKRALSGMASIIVMRRVRAATPVGRGVGTKGVTANAKSFLIVAFEKSRNCVSPNLCSATKSYDLSGVGIRRC